MRWLNSLDVTALMLILSFSLLLYLPLPLLYGMVVEKILPFFICLIAECVAKHKWKVLLLSILVNIAVAYIIVLPKIPPLVSGLKDLIFSIKKMFDSFSPIPAPQPNYDENKVTLFLLFSPILSHLLGLIFAKLTIKELKLRERIGK